ncbi:MAG TPA: GNAT family N-acetyltransferase, partial [Puia sp.]|nr:GNAT family N-acetyltransferase [Puia sp.]
MNYILDTKRLRLREFTTDDTKFIIQLVNSPGWLEFIGDRNIRTTEQAKEYLENGPIKSYRENGFGLFLVETKNHQTPVGMCGLIKRGDLENPDIGFALLPEFTGKGFAFEMATGTMEFAKNTLKMPVILAITVPHNIRSRKLLEKLGLTCSRTITHQNNSEE